MGAHDHHHDHFHGHSHSHPPKKKNNLKLYALRFAHSNAYVAIPILAVTMSSFVMVGNFNFEWNYLSFLFFSTLFLYPLHRLIGLRLTNPIDYSQAQKSVVKQPLLARVSVAIGFLGTVFFTTQLSLEIFQFLLPLAIVSITYSLPLIPTGGGWKRLRDIPGIKIYAISLVVTITTSSIPHLIMGLNHYEILLFGAERFLFILAITIPFDVRDIRIDSKWKLKTIPLITSKETALSISRALLILSSLVTLTHSWMFNGNIFIAIAIVLGNIWAIYVIEKFKTFNAPLFNAFLLEGTMVFHFALITITQVMLTF